MNTVKKILLIAILPIFLLFLFIYRNQNIEKRQAMSASGATNTEVCPLDYNPVCGEDKVTYSNECKARKNATLIAYAGVCRMEETNSGKALKAEPKTESFSGKTNDQYYNELESQCGDDECCIGSTRTMRVAGYHIAQDGECALGEQVNSADCAGSLQWCEPTNGTPGEKVLPSDEKSQTISNTAPVNEWNIAPSDKRTPYYNAANNYGFDVPKWDYFSGYGARDGASHTVGIASGTGVTSFETAPVKVYYYKKILSELTNAESGKIQIGNRTYIKLTEGSVLIEWDLTSKTASTIIATIKNWSWSTTSSIQP